MSWIFSRRQPLQRIGDRPPQTGERAAVLSTGWQQRKLLLRCWNGNKRTWQSRAWEHWTLDIANDNNPGFCWVQIPGGADCPWCGSGEAVTQRQGGQSSVHSHLQQELPQLAAHQAAQECGRNSGISAGVDFRRQNLTSVDFRFWRLKSIPALKD